jgi:hypothetical protein
VLVCTSFLVVLITRKACLTECSVPGMAQGPAKQKDRRTVVRTVVHQTQRLIRLAKCERAIRRLHRAGESLPHHERHPFRDPIEDKSLCRQERWVTIMTEEFLPEASKRVKDRQETGQRSLTAYWSQTPRILS